MAVCWSIALADRINWLKAETENANRALSDSEHKLSEILEGLPLGVVMYGKDRKPSYANRRTFDILSSPAQGIQVDLSAGRTLEKAIEYFHLQEAGSGQAYPLEKFPIESALHGEPASADDIEADRGDRHIPLEMWASPVRNDAGQVESAVVAFQDITGRKQIEAELDEYRQHLESLVENRTAELTVVNEQLQLRIDWLSAINQVNQTMASSADFQQVYQKIIEIINHLFSTQDAFIAEFDAGAQQLKILAHSCRSDVHPELIGSVTSLPEPILPAPNLAGEILRVYSKAQLSALSGPVGMHVRTTPIESIGLVPLRMRDRAIGFLGLEMHDKERTLTHDESSLLSIFSTDIAQLIGNERLYEQSKALITAEERNRLARDLHDSVTQVLFSATLLAEVLPQIWRRDPEQGLQRLEKLHRLTRGALAEMRTMLLELRPTAVINTPLSNLVAQLTEAITSRSGLKFRLFIEQVPALPEAVHTSFYRIAQEGLNNVVKHAQARLVTVSLSAKLLPAEADGRARHEIRLLVEDDGVGFSAGRRAPEQLGIGIMRERAAAIQARFSLESQPGHGTQLTLVWRGETGSPE
jgi:signal transduction histidine kinase